MRRLTVLLTVAGFVVLIAADGLAQAPSALGTWTLNVAKSKYDPDPAPKSQTTIQSGVPGGGMKAISDQVDASGRTLHTEITTMFDGKEAVLNGAAVPTTRVYKRIDDRTYEFVTRVQGKVTTTTRVAIAADGKTRTITTTGTDEQGRRVNNVALWDRK